MEKLGPQHWQSLWERDHPEYRRVQQKDWDTPLREDWSHAWTTPCFIPPRRRFWLRIRWDALPSPTGLKSISARSTGRCW